jgi:hypothetical protein
MHRLRHMRRAAVAAFVVAGVLAGAPAATADTKPKLSIKPGQKIVIKAPSPAVPGKADLFGGLQPTDCDTTVADLGSSEFCDAYPVFIDASDDLILSGNLQLGVSLEWKKGTYLPNCPQIGNCGTNEMGLEIWKDPPEQAVGDRGAVLVGDCEIPEGQLPEGDIRQTYTDVVCPYPDPSNKASASSTGLQGTPDTPIALGLPGVGICGKRMDDKVKLPANNVCHLLYVDVGNYNGSNPYTLTIELLDFSGLGPVDLSAEGDVPFQDLSGDTPPPPEPFSGGASGSFSAIVLPAFDLPATGTGAPRVDLPGLGSSAGFDGIGLGALPDSDLARRIVERGPKALGAAGPASGLLLFLWLVALPLGGIGSFLFFVWRRRREEDQQAAAA